MRTTLRKRISKWLRLQLRFLPAIEPQLNDNWEDIPEKFMIRLPSTPDLPSHTCLSLTEAAKLEYQMRQGQAQDALSAMKIAILNKIANMNYHKSHVQVYDKATQSTELMHKQDQLIIQHPNTYRWAHKALLTLGLSPSDPNYQTLLAVHCHTKAIFAEQKQKKESLPSTRS